MLGVNEKQYLHLFATYILVSVAVFALLAVVHSWITYNDIQLVYFLVPVFAGAVVGFLMARNKVLRIQLRLLANTDALTGAYNRLYFDKRLNEEIDRAKRYKNRFSILYLDLDHFKQVNDQYGHSVGDEVLIDFARIVQHVNRESDLFARVGGEEFIVLAQMTDNTSAQTVYQRIKQATDEHLFSKVKKVTFSAGITEFNIEKDTANSLLVRADKALYRAKEGGRNQAVIA